MTYHLPDVITVEVGIELGEEAGHRTVELVVGGVELLGTVQADDADRTIGLDLDAVR